LGLAAIPVGYYVFDRWVKSTRVLIIEVHEERQELKETAHW
jgi:hypothetical protein